GRPYLNVAEGPRLPPTDSELQRSTLVLTSKDYPGLCEPVGVWNSVLRVERQLKRRGSQRNRPSRRLPCLRARRSKLGEHVSAARHRHSGGAEFQKFPAIEVRIDLG